MTIFMRHLTDEDKASALFSSCAMYRKGYEAENIFLADSGNFKKIPGSPLAYWVSSKVIDLFSKYPTLEGRDRIGRQGIATADDFRFVRAWWEVIDEKGWFGFAKGGKFSPFYADIHLVANWHNDGAEIKNFSDAETGKIRSRPQSTEYYFRPGITWSLVTTLKLSARVLPKNCIISVIGPGVYISEDNFDKILATSAIMNSKSYIYLLEMQLGLAAEGRRAYQVGTINRVPFPAQGVVENELILRNFAYNSWSLKRDLDSIDESSHAFSVPEAMRHRLDKPKLEVISIELENLQNKLDEFAFDLYGFGEADRSSVLASAGSKDDGDGAEESDDGEEDENIVNQTDGLLSWAAGIAFGRFDWRLATGERGAPPEPDPFDPLPAKSPGMLPDGAAPFHAHSGILVDDQGHPHDLPRLIEEVLARVEAEVPGDVRRWLLRDFFPLHLKQYSKSRRKAPIYWPLSTTSGSYTLWLYYPSISSQTLYSAVNDFIEPKLEQVSREAGVLRNKGAARSRNDEKSLEALQAVELELIELRDTLLHIAPTYRPNHHDGVQITAAPLWQLFRHKPWQKILKDTWAKLEKGEYDWAHLAMAYWPDRVREKCKNDKSLAIAHDLEALYIEPEQRSPKSGKLKKDAE